jgi:hypothetical protein
MLLSKQRQAGSAGTFVIIAIILVVVTIGGITLVVRRGEQVRKDSAASQLAAQQAAQKAVQKAQDQAVKDAAAAAAKAAAVATTSSSTTSITSGALPTTGAELNITATIAVGLLTITATSFAASRRSLKRSL